MTNVLGIDQAQRKSALCLVDPDGKALFWATFDYGTTDKYRDPVEHVDTARKTLGTVLDALHRDYEIQKVWVEDALAAFGKGDPKPGIRLNGWLITKLLDLGQWPGIVLPGPWQKAMGFEKPEGVRVAKSEHRKAWAIAKAIEDGFDPMPAPRNADQRKEREDLSDAYLIARYGHQLAAQTGATSP